MSTLAVVNRIRQTFPVLHPSSLSMQRRHTRRIAKLLAPPHLTGVTLNWKLTYMLNPRQIFDLQRDNPHLSYVWRGRVVWRTIRHALMVDTCGTD